MAVNSETGLLQWVVDGTLVENTTVPQVKDIKNKPTDLSGKIVLGVTQKSGGWESRISNQVTNLNIYRKKQLDELVDLTSSPCENEGDLLSWNSSTWDDTGSAAIWEEADQTVIK